MAQKCLVLRPATGVLYVEAAIGEGAHPKADACPRGHHGKTINVLGGKMFAELRLPTPVSPNLH